MVTECSGFNVADLLGAERASSARSSPADSVQAESPVEGASAAPRNLMMQLNPLLVQQMFKLYESQQQQAKPAAHPMEWYQMMMMNMGRAPPVNPVQAWNQRNWAWMQSLAGKSAAAAAAAAAQKRKGGQIRFTNEQTDSLEDTFDKHKYLTNSQRRKLAKQLSLSERQVKTWFQNRRAKWRRVRKDGDEEEEQERAQAAPTPGFAGFAPSAPPSAAAAAHNPLFAGLFLPAGPFGGLAPPLPPRPDDAD